MINRHRLLFAIFAITAFVAACTSANTDADNDPGTLILYSGRSESLIAPLIEQFSESTGIEVKVRYGNTAELAATLMEEGKNSPADLFFAQDPGGLGAVASAGLLVELPQDILNRVDQRFRSTDNLWVGVSGRARVVVYNTETVSLDELPDDLHGFTDPKWKGRIGLPPTNSSFQTMVTGMRNSWGEAATRAWLEGIMQNEPEFYEKNTPVVAAVGAGEVDIGFVNHYYLYRFLEEEGDNFPARNYFLPAGGPGSLIMAAGIAKLATGENEDNAIKFIEYLLSRDAQEYFARETFEYPLIPNVEIHTGLIPLSDLLVNEIAAEDLADLQGTIKLLQDVGMLP